MKFNSDSDKGTASGLFIGYTVLLLHVLLILGLGVAVVLIKGIYDFRWLILIGGIILLGGSCYFFYQRLKASNRSLREAMNDPALRDRTLEISVLGGMASVKLGHKDEGVRLLEENRTEIPQLLEAPQTTQVQELEKLAKMLDEELITREEFQQLKKGIVD